MYHAFNDTNKIPKIENYIAVIEQYSEEQFKRNFRISQRTTNMLIEKFQTTNFFNSKSVRGFPITPAKVQILAFLWFAGNKCTIRDVASRFGMAESTFHKTAENVIDFLVLELAPTIIKFPETDDEKTQVADEFERISGFPGVLGCIDGTYIYMRTPAYKIKSTYVNRHDFPSLTLQAICDAKKRFLDVFTGISSKIHDARVFKLSFISTKLEHTCGDQFHLLGDAAYPLRKYLITPYRDYGNLTDAQRNFNYKFSATRVKIENAFGLLKQRFCQLTRTDFLTVDKTSKFIISCCVLHNLCINNDDLWEYNQEFIDAEDVQANNNDDNERARRLGERKRNDLCNVLL